MFEIKFVNMWDILPPSSSEVSEVHIQLIFYIYIYIYILDFRIFLLPNVGIAYPYDMRYINIGPKNPISVGLYLKLQLVTLWKTSITFCVLFRKKCHVNTHRQLLVSDVVWGYGEIFSNHSSVLRYGKNPIAPVLFVQSVTLSVLSVLIGRSKLHFLATGDVGTSCLSCSCLILWLALTDNRAFASDTVNRLKLKQRWSSLPCCNFPCNHFISVQTGLKRESDNKQNITWAGANGRSGVTSQRVSWHLTLTRYYVSRSYQLRL